MLLHKPSLKYSALLLFLLSVACLTSLVSSPIALVIGILFANTVQNPFPTATSQITKKLLQACIIGLGFGMNVTQALQASQTGFALSVGSILFTLLGGWWLGNKLGIDRNTSFLVTAGTAICGGSAIAAVSPLVRAEEKQMSVALGTVFLLNSAALLLFPWIGHLANLTQAHFGMWAALAIHDTSSVVGAGQSYGEEALRVATTVKLARALWIVPFAFFTAWRFKQPGQKIYIPYFIGGFLLAMLLRSYAPITYTPTFNFLSTIAHRGLTLTLFLIGTNLSWNTFRDIGLRPLVMGTLLWVALGSSSLLIIELL